MFVIGFPAAAFGTNCFVMAPAEGEECVIVDPGVGVVDRLREALGQFRLRPSAVLLTHGHIDHTYSVTPVCGAHGIAAHIHGADAYRLRDALAAVDPALLSMLRMEYGDVTWRDPDDVVTFEGGVDLELAGMSMHVEFAPGHTEGSVMFRMEGLPDSLPEDAGLTRTLIAGDVLFAGGIGRTDLPGGSDEQMRATLRDVVLAEHDDTLVLPGHGPATTIGRERMTNPWLSDL